MMHSFEEHLLQRADSNLSTGRTCCRSHSCQKLEERETDINNRIPLTVLPNLGRSQQGSPNVILSKGLDR